MLFYVNIIHLALKGKNKLMGHIALLKNQFKSIKTFAQSYDHNIMLIKKEQNPLSPHGSWEMTIIDVCTVSH